MAQNSQSSILRVPLLAFSDRILFEDALGRTFRIEHEYFKDWGVCLILCSDGIDVIANCAADF